MTLRDDVRARRETRWAAVIGGGFLGVVFGLGHPLGFFLGGAAAGLGQPSVFRGVVAGALAGLLAWVAFLAGLASTGALEPALAATAPLAVSLAAPLVLGAFGGLLRGVDR
ncbi:hypothetical protein [Halocalculus aciditolerans]|uniref:Uncharacterized protein n=1 Tax=Halocalculus aciditolerans TaxID=1383812 RepID=A0A830F247_9EURY|nr:hypothetical protein [Halocalculus aciditolerans]GGL54834.1 hypothetical protein GCM10009039_11180 [Halocalculus aciditolerans]